MTTKNTIDVEYVAKLARIELSAEEAVLFQRQLADIVGYVEKIRELDVGGIEPTAHGVPMTNVFRKDAPEDWPGCKDALANAPALKDSQFRVPQIVE